MMITDRNYSFQISFTPRTWRRYVFYSDFIVGGRLLRYLIPVMLLLFIAGFQYFRYKNSGNCFMLIGVSIVYLLALFIPFIFNTRKQYQQYHNAPETWQMDERGISGNLFQEPFFTEWENIARCIITPHCVYLYLNALLPIYLPKDAFTDEEFAFLMEKLQQE